tara:strand:- start:440 stop:589 length:150 start_codon:yes stop_codon:yes gene_type:complete
MLIASKHTFSQNFALNFDQRAFIFCISELYLSKKEKNAIWNALPLLNEV